MIDTPLFYMKYLYVYANCFLFDLNISFDSGICHERNYDDKDSHDYGEKR